MRFFISLCFLPFFASAASELSSWILFTQLFNFSIFSLLLFFLLRKPVQLLCYKRQKDFFAFEKQSLELEEKKRAENKIWEEKLSQLKNKEKNIKTKAQEQGDRFRAEKQEDLKELKERLKNHSDFLVHLETEKLKQKQLKYWKRELIKNSKIKLLDLAGESSFQKKEKENFINFLTHHKKEA